MIGSDLGMSCKIERSWVTCEAIKARLADSTWIITWSVRNKPACSLRSQYSTIIDHNLLVTIDLKMWRKGIDQEKANLHIV